MLFRLFLLAAALWVIGLGVFATRLPSIPSGVPVAAEEGIVVPTGGAERVATGFALLDGGAQRLLITGVHPDTTLAALEKVAGRSARACCVDIDHSAPNTAGNAAAAAEWAAANGIGRLRLVTSWYHMPRSMLLFQQALPEAVITPHPVFPAEPPRDGWWQTGLGWRLIVGEYTKLLWVWAMPDAAKPLGTQ